MGKKIPNKSAGSPRYRALFENSADAMLVIENERFIDCNRAAVELLGYKVKDALMEVHPSEISPEFQPDGQSSFDKANMILSRIGKKGGTERFEWIHVKADGEHFPVEVLLTMIPRDEGSQIHVTLRDLTEKKRLEKELRLSQKMEVVGTLAGGMAHDFGNTLVPITIFADLLSKRLEGQPECQEWANEIGKASARGANLVKKLLSVARREIRQPVLMDLEGTVNELLDLIDKMLGDNVDLNFEGSGKSLWVKADPGEIEQILLNLISNSRDAMFGRGNLHLKISTTDIDGSPSAQISVADTGTGMDSETMARIFEPFFTTKDTGRGTGLGMSTVRELVTRTGGRVSVASTNGEGTTIEVAIPLVDQKSSAKSAGPIASTEQVDQSLLDGLKILLVEDDAYIVTAIEKVLVAKGCEVIAVANGAEAIDAVESFNPELLLTDVVMPLMSGPELAWQLKRNGCNIPVLFMSGYTDDRLAEYGFDAQNVALLRKPFTEAKLILSIEQAFELNGTV